MGVKEVDRRQVLEPVGDPPAELPRSFQRRPLPVQAERMKINALQLGRRRLRGRLRGQDMDLVPLLAQAVEQLNHEFRQDDLPSGIGARQAQRRDSQPGPQAGRPPLLEDLALVPQATDLLAGQVLLDQECRMPCLGSSRRAGEGHGGRVRGGNELPVPQQESHLGQLPRARRGNVEVHLSGDRGQGSVVQAVGIQSREFDIRHVVHAEDHATMVPGIAALLPDMLDPVMPDPPMDETSRRMHHADRHVIDRGNEALGGPPLADLPVQFRSATGSQTAASPACSGSCPGPIAATAGVISANSETECPIH